MTNHDPHEVERRRFRYRASHAVCTTDEFNESITKLTAGLPITMVMSRLLLLLKAVLDAGGEPAAAVFRSFVIAKTTSDSEEE